MTIEERIRMTVHNKTRVYITPRLRSARGFKITASNHSPVIVPNKKTALAFLYAVVRCEPEKVFRIQPVRGGAK